MRAAAPVVVVWLMVVAAAPSGCAPWGDEGGAAPQLPRPGGSPEQAVERQVDAILARQAELQQRQDKLETAIRQALADGDYTKADELSTQLDDIIAELLKLEEEQQALVERLERQGIDLEPEPDAQAEPAAPEPAPAPAAP